MVADITAVMAALYLSWSLGQADWLVVAAVAWLLDDCYWRRLCYLDALFDGIVLDGRRYHPFCRLYH